MTALYPIFDIISYVCLVAGGIFCVIGGIGIIRLPDFYADPWGEYYRYNGCRPDDPWTEFPGDTTHV